MFDDKINQDQETFYIKYSSVWNIYDTDRTPR